MDFIPFISISTALQETKRFEAVANLVVEKNCYEHAHCQNITRGMLCHTHAVFLDQIPFKQHINTMVKVYRGVYCKHQIKRLLYDTQKNLE